jgi:hypothetical protein
MVMGEEEAHHASEHSASSVVRTLGTWLPHAPKSLSSDFILSGELNHKYMSNPPISSEQRWKVLFGRGNTRKA